MSFSYSAYGLGIQSDLELPELLPGPAEHDVTIRLNGHSSDPEMEGRSGWKMLNRQEAILRLEGAGVYRVCRGREITVGIAKDSDENWARAVLLGVVMGVLLYQRNYLVLHASSVQIGESAVAFLGHTGQGKSSIAAALVARGHCLMADEPTCLDLEGGSLQVLSGYRQLKLDPSVAMLLGFDSACMHALYRKEEKRGLRITGAMMGKKVPLRSVYVLTNGEVALERIGPSAGLMELVRHSHPKQAVSDYFRQCGRVAEAVPMFRLGRGKETASLLNLSQIVEEHNVPAIAG